MALLNSLVSGVQYSYWSPESTLDKSSSSNTILCNPSQHHSHQQTFLGQFEMKNAAKNPKPSGKPGAQDMRRNRKSGMSGTPKKGGHGGKFTWSGDGYSDAELGRFENDAVDANDPNFDDHEEVAGDCHGQ